jgi:hypothetical protein
MQLEDLCEAFRSFPAAEEQAHPERGLVAAGRSAVEAAVIDDEFLADCISAELRLFEFGQRRRGLASFFTIPDSQIRFAFGYWQPGQSAPPHEHAGWTITAVCRNELEILTYDRSESYRRGQLVSKNRFQAPAGRVGFIFEPCIHQPRNSTRDWALSLHVIGPRDRERPSDQPEELPALNMASRESALEHDPAYATVLAARQRIRLVHQLARIVATMDVKQAPALLAQCSALGSSRTREFINRMPRSLPQPQSLEERPFLARTSKDLAISWRCVGGDMVALDVETSHGAIEEFAINDVAREAIAFAAKEPRFDVRAMPGNLTDSERQAIAQALEETGLFVRVAQ